MKIGCESNGRVGYVHMYISQKTYSATLPRTGVVGNLRTVQSVKCAKSGKIVSRGRHSNNLN